MNTIGRGLRTFTTLFVYCIHLPCFMVSFTRSGSGFMLTTGIWHTQTSSSISEYPHSSLHDRSQSN
jgi:hypothetical protein